MIAAALLMLIPPPPPQIGPMRGNIDCLLERAGKSYSAMIELNQESGKEVVLRGLGLSHGVTVASVDLDGGVRRDRGYLDNLRLRAAEPGKPDRRRGDEES